MPEIISKSQDMTLNLGIRFGAKAKSGAFFALNGDLGAGKSVFARGIARGLGISEPVQSPTFTIMNVYDNARLPFYHFDAYRLDEEDELEALGYEDYFFGDGITVVEWAENIGAVIPKERIDINIEHVDTESSRIISINAYGDRYLRLLEEVGI